MVNYNKQKAIKSLVNKLGQINTPRVSDGCTPLHLIAWKKYIELTKMLLELGADPKAMNMYEEDSSDLVALVAKSNNIVFLDLELTAIPSDPTSSILEVAIVITDEQLVEIDRKGWIISKPDSEIDALPDWHQNQFRDIALGGNGLFADIKDSSKAKPLDEIQKEVIEFVKEYCPSQRTNSLAGFSVHGDREVLKYEIPELYKWMSHQIIDVSTILNLAKKWTPLKLTGKPENMNGNHRAMSDVIHSIETLKFCREGFFSV